ncbi:MAG: hypothetical protein M0D55_08835 [Elusimicrobiota bacterium]|nr:MAG: hypothetical protein M0D55_08835 [Elusimicrobiota bacterium]
MVRSSEATFGLDARVEVLSVLQRLARPPGAAPRGARAYAGAIRARFAAFAAHPAVAALRALLSAGKSEPLLTEVALLLPDAGGLADAETSAFSRTRRTSRAPRAPGSSSTRGKGIGRPFSGSPSGRRGAARSPPRSRRTCGLPFPADAA